MHRYQVETTAGQGAYAAVVCAVDLESKKQVALKMYCILWVLSSSKQQRIICCLSGIGFIHHLHRAMGMVKMSKTFRNLFCEKLFLCGQCSTQTLCGKFISCSLNAGHFSQC